jgi:hypothetical protein
MPEANPAPAAETEQKKQSPAPRGSRKKAAVEPSPDQFGRLRVLDQDTGHVLTINAIGFPHGNYVVVDEPASDPVTGLPVPPVHNESGQQAEKEGNGDA